MPSVLLTAFEPYDRWPTNASWLALVELTKQLPEQPALTTRLYPVDFKAARRRLQEDLQAGYDVALHVGQAPGATRILLEAVGLNVAGEPGQPADQFGMLADDGPLAYRSSLPLSRWTSKLTAAGIPAAVSYHAGTYLCNSLLYLGHHLGQQQRLKTRVGLIHVPLDVTQVSSDSAAWPSLPSAVTAQAIRLILDDIAAEA